MKPSIFISHSCKDAEEPEAAGDPERAERLLFARELRQDISDSLLGTDHFDVWLDVRGGLRPGDNWRRGIHRALRICSGAVLLLSPEALASGWVLKETTILVWRALLGEPVLVVPIRVGVSDSDLCRHGFDPSGVEAVQAEVVEELTTAERERVVASVIKRFESATRDGNTTRSTWSKTVGRWVTQVADMLRMPDLSYAQDMFDVLELEADDGRFDDPYLTVAGELLDCDPDHVLGVLDVVRTARTSPQRRQFVEAAQWLWVSAGAAHRLPLVAAQAGVRLAVIDGKAPLTGEDYVHRAYCGIRPDRVVAPDDRTDGTPQQAIARIEALLKDFLPSSSSEALARDIAQNGPFYLVLGPSLCLPDVLTFLTRRYAALTVVALLGDDDVGRLGSFAAHAQRLQPGLEGREEAGLRYRKRLGCFV